MGQLMLPCGVPLAITYAATVDFLMAGLQPEVLMPGSLTTSASELTVDVCVCTFRRVSVRDLLASLAAQVLPDGWVMRIIVADNDDVPSGRPVVEDAFLRYSLTGRYIHAPARNISVARNACLAASEAQLIAFADDDEVARPDWLRRLIAERNRSGAGVVFGRVQAVYADDAPAWMRQADMHSTPRPFYRGRIAGGYTCNVLISRDVIGGLLFNPAFGRSGGEDTAFFRQLQKRGVKMAFAEDAVVDEPVKPERYGLGWMGRRAFRSGQTWGLLEIENGGSRFGLVIASLAKVAASAGFLVLTFWSPPRWRRAAVRACFHTGVMAASAGRAPLEIYGEGKA